MPTDTQPKFELGDTSEDIERRIGERGERERQEQERGGWKERGQKEPSRWKRVRKGQRSDLKETLL